MAKVKITGHASGTGVITVTSPDTSTDRTITLPDSSGTLLDENSSVPAANITGTLPAISGANLTNLPASGSTTFSGLTDTTISASEPTISSNPSAVGHFWVNSSAGSCFICTDATTGANVWLNVAGHSGDIGNMHDNLIAWYKDAGTQDSGPNSWHGTEIGSSGVSSQSSTGPWSGTKAVTLFPSTEGAIQLPNDTIITGTNDRTISAWVRPNGTVGQQNYIFGFGYCVSPYGRTFNARMGSEKMGFMGCGSDHDGYGDTVYSEGNWVRVWYTYDGSDIKTYYTTNGTINQSWSWGFSGETFGGSGATAAIGGHASSPTNYNAKSYMRDFRIYNSILSTTEMEDMWDD